MAVDFTKNASPIDVQRRVYGFLQQSVGNKITITYTDSTKETIDTITFNDGSQDIYTISVTGSATTDVFTRTS